MANIYEEKNEPLHQLIDRARSDEGATVVIPDLQRPYVWTPNQVILLVDSLIRGWPFGTLLMWKVAGGDLQNIPHRSFWKVVDRTDEQDSSTVSRRDPPGSFHMVLDGQQRVQSMLLALGEDGWGFKMDDRDWVQEIHERRQRGRRGRYTHWSKASVCFDLDAFLAAYKPESVMSSAAGTTLPGLARGSGALATRFCGGVGREAQWAVVDGAVRSRVGPTGLRRRKPADRDRTRCRRWTGVGHQPIRWRRLASAGGRAGTRRTPGNGH